MAGKKSLGGGCMNSCEFAQQKKFRTCIVLIMKNTLSTLTKNVRLPLH